MNNLIILKQAIRLSRVIKDLREARCKLNSVLAQTEYFIVQGENSNIIENNVKASVGNCLYTEQYLRSSVSKCCKCLDGFNPSTMDPFDYISSSDVKNKYVDICRGKSIVATVDLSTGTVRKIKPEHKSSGEDKSSAEKS